MYTVNWHHADGSRWLIAPLVFIKVAERGVCVADRTVAADTVYILEHVAAAAASEAITVHVLSRQYQNSRYPEFKRRREMVSFNQFPDKKNK